MRLLQTIVRLALLVTGTSFSAVHAGDAAVREVSFAAPDGAKIFAHLYGGGDHAVVLAHGAVFDKESWAPLARELASAGLRVLAIDFRGYGKSKGGGGSGKLYLDVLGAVEYLRTTGAKRVSLLGGSMGGGAVGEAAVRTKPGEIDQLILLAAAPVTNPEQLPGRKLFIVSEGDGSASTVREQFQRAKEPKKLVTLAGSAHAQHLFKTAQAKSLTATILAWLLGTSP